MLKLIHELDKACCKTQGEIKVVNWNISETKISVLFPYSSSEFEFEIEGNSDEEKVESFVEQINHFLDSMIDHLEDCKL